MFYGAPTKDVEQQSYDDPLDTGSTCFGNTSNTSSYPASYASCYEEI